jgi:outer membrane protein assembly factor BamA
VQFLRQDILNGNVIARASARGSIRSAYLLDAEMGLPQLAGGKAFVDFYLRRRHSPQVAFYGIGPDTTDALRSNYLLEDTTADVTFGLKPAKWIGFSVTGGYLNTNVGPGTSGRYPSTDQVFSRLQVPGLSRQSDFLRGGLLAVFDWRDSVYGPRSGGRYYGRFDYYDDRNDTQFNFRRFTADAQQFVPLFNKKRVIALRAKTILSYPNAGQEVPFYLQPSLGSSDDLRGFGPFRYLDRNSLVLNAEWRWEIMSNVEGAIFADAGKVFPRPGLVNFRGLQKSYGGGLRFRAPGSNAMIFRLDVAGSREGVQVWFVFNDIMAAPEVRTGRELSPRPGRLP